MEISELDAFCSEQNHSNRLLLEKQLSIEENVIPLLRIMMSPEADQEYNASQKRRDATCFLLTKICRTHLGQFTELLLGNDAELASGAAQILGRQRDPKALKALVSSLDDSQPPVLNWMIWGLGQSESSGVIDKLSKFLRHKSKSVRVSATIALGNFPGEDVTRLLVSALKDSSANVRWEAAETFARRDLDEPDVEIALEPLKTALKDRNEHVRSQASNALGHLYDDRAVPDLLIALQDESDEVRSFAAKGLGLIGSSEAFEPLIKRLDDRAWFVRSAAAEALAEMGDVRAIPILESKIKDNDAFVIGEIRKAIKALSS